MLVLATIIIFFTRWGSACWSGAVRDYINMALVEYLFDF